jgi:autotransporter translocation and assembly factor TamB
MPRFRPLHITAAVSRALVYAIAALLVVVLLAIAAVETGWVKNAIRRLIVSQANNYLTARLDIGRLEGSLFRGLTLDDVHLTQDGQTIVSIDEVKLTYSIRELFEPGLIIRSVRLTKPRVLVARLADGRWNMSAIVKRESRQRERSGPGRPLHVLAIEVADGDVEIRDDLSFGDVHIPSRYASLNATGSFDYKPVTWTIRLANISWTGDATHLAMERLAGDWSVGPQGWEFDNLSVRTPRSAFAVSGRVNRDTQPVSLDLHVEAARFAFQEWSPVVNGLKNLDVECSYSLALAGPVNKLSTDINLHSKSGDVQTSLVLDTRAPGWHAAGRGSVADFDISHWINKPDHQSKVTGNVTFDLDLDLGRHFPRGSFDFAGPHAGYIGYEADDVKARGTLTATDALIADATGTAYGSSFHLTGSSIGIDAPNAFHFRGSDANMDLRKLPPQVPLTHVESLVALDAFDVTGQFDAPSFIRGGATFGGSEYLGAQIAAGASGTIDTSATPVVYGGEGDVTRLDIGRFGEGLDTPWMKDPRWAGVVSGHFHVNGAGAEGPTMTIDGGGRLFRADIFGGQLSNADVSVHIANGTLTGTYDGRLVSIAADKALGDPRFAATLTGAARATFVARELLVRETELADYDVDGSLDAESSVVRGLPISRGSLFAKMHGTELDIRSMEAHGQSVDFQGAGLLEFDGDRSSQFHYVVESADLALAKDTVGNISGTITTTGDLSGPLAALHAAGHASLDNVDLGGTTILSTIADYDLTFPSDMPAAATGTIKASSTELELLGREVPSAEAALAFNNGQIDADVTLVPQTDPLSPIPTIKTSVAGVLRSDARAFDISRLSLAIGNTPAWQLTNVSPPPAVSWTDGGFQTAPLEFADMATGNQRASVSGSWRSDGSGALRLAGSRISLDTLTGEPGRPGRYGGTVEFDATLRGTQDRPSGQAMFAITDGRVRKLAYQRLGGEVDYHDGLFRVDLRLDQAPGVWLTAKGSVPAGIADKDPPSAPIDLAIASSTVGLGLLEGVTDVVRDVTGQAVVNVNVSGTARDPHFSGTVSLTDAAFLVASTGARYKNGRATFELATDRVNVSSFHLEDRGGRPLDVTGSLGTHALAVGDIHIDLSASHFEVLRNATGTVDVNTKLTLRGEVDAPRIAGDLTILSGDLKVDEIFARALYQPYATEEVPAPPGTVNPATGAVAGAEAAEPIDALAALNPWDRLGLDITIHSPGTLRLTGDNVQVAQGTPLGLGSFNLRATGDVYLYKDPGQPAYISGSFDSISGHYAFQGRRFEVDPTSSINFRGDFNPEIYVTVSRDITGVIARVTIAGNLQQPELRLSSTPPLESSDILSLIVFGTGSGDLSVPQQQELAVRAGTLAYGFVASPLVAALQRSLGLETLEIAPPTGAAGPSITVGNELVPGLVAQFTRGFGQEAYDEATVEYYLSRIFRIRATFSDAQSLVGRSPFRRIERAGIDLLMFFSF